MTRQGNDTRWFIWLAIGCILAVIICTQFLPEPISDYGRTAIYLSDAKYERTLRVESLNYSDFLKTYGTPDKIENEIRADGVPLMIATFPGFALRSYFSDECPEPVDRLYPHIISVTVHDPEYRFGWLRIGVGSPRILVHLAYLLDPPLDAAELREAAPADEGYYGEDWSKMLFCYDANDRVETMTYVIAPH